MEKLSARQARFTLMLGQLIIWAYEQGFKITMASGYCKPGEGGHMPSSLHYLRLAQDINLFIDGVYQEESEPYGPLGAFWKGLSPDNRWGGDFRHADGNHFSLSYKGIA